MKENDYFLNRMLNSDFSNLDFMNIGLSSDNTSLESKDTYEKLEYVQTNPLFQTEGKFDKQKFNEFYNESVIGYNRLSQANASQEVAKQLTYFRGDIFAPVEQRDLTPQFTIIKQANPQRQKVSNWGINTMSAPTMSAREIAQTQQTWDYINNKWVDSPNDDGFFGNFFDTKVLATFDSDGVHTDPITGQQVEHKKGQKKLNENGTYYYETLGNRDIYGKDVLSKFDVITKDGSVYNKFDFFDSDDIEKNLFGSLVRNVVKVAPAFIPYVAPWYIGARVGLETVNLFTKLGKIVAGSDSPKLSAIEGFIKSTDFSTSDYASQHMWSVENLLNMSADVFTQLAEQRWLFEYAPSLMKGSKLGFSKEAQKKFTTDFQAKRLSELKNIKKLKEQNIAGLNNEKDLATLLWSDGAMKADAVAQANLALEEALKSNYKIGEYLSKAYMTGVTVADSYGEAKASGASDLEAALFTLGYAIGEYGILNTQLGEWILPELRVEKQKMRQIIKQVTQKNPMPQAAASKDIKLNWMQKLIKSGKDWFNGEFTGTGTGKIMASHMISNALGEGVEEVSEEALQDFSKVLANGIYWATGSKTHLRPTWEDEEGNFNLMNTINDYALNFVGGFIGGGIGNLNPTFREANRIKKLSEDSSAFQEMLYYLREGKADEFKEIASKMQLGDSNLSVVRNGYGYEQGTSDNNQDKQAKQQFNQYIDRLDQILKLDRDIKNDDGVRMDLILKDIRFQHLLDSNVASSYLQDYNSTVADFVRLTNEIEGLQSQKKSDSDKESEEKNKDIIQAKEEELEKVKEKLHQYTDGTEGKEFIRDAMFEMEHGISKGYSFNNILDYIHAREEYDGHHRPISAIPETVLNKYKEEWNSKNLSYKDEIRFKRKVFDYYNNKLSNALTGHIQEYFDDFNDKFLVGTFEESNQLVMSGINDTTDLTLASNQLNSFLSAKGAQNTTNGNIDRKNILLSVILNELNKQDSSITPMHEVFTAIRQTENAGLLYDSQNNKWRLTEEQFQLLKTFIPELAKNYSKNLEEYDKKLVDNLVANHNNLFKAFSNYILTKYNGEIQNLIKQQKFLKASTRQYLKEFIDTYALDDDKQTYISAIDSLKYTPIAELIDSEQVSLDDASIKTSTLITELEKQAFNAASSGTLSEYGYDNTWEDAIANAQHLITILESHLAAGRTDDINPMNPFGYNYSVNKLIPDANLITFDKNTYNVLAQDLDKLRTELAFYKKIVQINENNLFSMQPKIAAERLFRVVEGLRLLFPTDVALQDWEGSEDFLKALKKIEDSELQDIYKSSTVPSSEQYTQYRKIKLEFDEAIYTFFQKNKSKSQEDFNSLLTKNATFVKNGANMTFPNGDSYESIDGGDTLHIKTVVAYLAAHASLSYGTFLKKYKEVLNSETDFVHTEGLENLLFHEVSFATQKELWDKFTEAYNSLQQQLLEQNKIGLPGDSSFLNGKDSKRNNHSTLLFKSTFLSEGIAGVGKSSSNLILLLKLINGVGTLTDRIFIVNKSEADAKRIKDDILKHVDIDENNLVCFSHTDYIKYINPNIPEPTITKTGIRYTNEQVANELVQYDDNTWHYKTEENINKDKPKPSLVIIDEVTNVSELDMFQHERYMQELNTRSIALGDFRQITLSGNFSMPNGIKEQLFTHRHNFFETFDLVFSFRSDNKYNSDSQKSIIDANKEANAIVDFSEAETFSDILEEAFPTYETKYHESDLGFFGIKVDNSINSDDISKTEFAKSLQIMLNTLAEGETITFVYDNPESKVLKYINSLNQGSKIITVQGSVQGQEGKYYIIEEPEFAPDNQSETLNTDKDMFKSHLKGIYTNLSRAKQGTIVIPNSVFGVPLFTESKKMPAVGKFTLTKQFKQTYNTGIASQIEDCLKDSAYDDLTIGYASKTDPKKPKDLSTLSDNELITYAESLESKGDISKQEIDKVVQELKSRTKIANTPKIKDLIEKLLKLKEDAEDDPDSDTADEDDDVLESESDKKPPYVQEDANKCIGQMYSFNAYEHGLVINDNKYYLQKLPPEIQELLNQTQQGKKLGNDDLILLAKHHISITGIQGLALAGVIKVGADNQIVEPEKAFKILNQIYYMFKYAQDGYINSELNKIFKGHIEGTITTRLAVKVTESSSKENYQRHKGSIANIRGIDPKKTNLIKPRNKKMIALIGIENGDYFNGITEIPLYTYPNPMSLLESFNLKDKWKQFKPTNVRKKLIEFVQYLEGQVNENPIYKNFIKLAYIFMANTDYLHYLTITKDGKQFYVSSLATFINNTYQDKTEITNTGIDIVSNTKGAEYEFTSEFTYLKSVQFLDELVGSIESNIYLIPQAVSFVEDIIIDGKIIAKKGKPYVIITENPKGSNNIDFNSAFGKYIENIKEGYPNPYKLISINAPSVSGAKYIEHIKNLYYQNNKEELSYIAQVGNKSSVFKVLLRLVNNEAYINAIKSKYKNKFHQDRFNALVNLLKEIQKYQKTSGESLAKILKVPVLELKKSNPQLFNSLHTVSEYSISLGENLKNTLHIVSSKGYNDGSGNKISKSLGTLLNMELVNLLFYGYKFSFKENEKHKVSQNKDGKIEENVFINEFMPLIASALQNQEDIYYTIPKVSDDEISGNATSVMVDGVNTEYIQLSIDFTKGQKFFIKGMNLSEKNTNEGRIQVSGKLDTCSLFGNIQPFIDAAEGASHTNSLSQEDINAINAYFGRTIKVDESISDEQFIEDYNIEYVRLEDGTEVLKFGDLIYYNDKIYSPNEKGLYQKSKEKIDKKVLHRAINILEKSKDKLNYNNKNIKFIKERPTKKELINSIDILDMWAQYFKDNNMDDSEVQEIINSGKEQVSNIEKKLSDITNLVKEGKLDRTNILLITQVLKRIWGKKWNPKDKVFIINNNLFIISEYQLVYKNYTLNSDSEIKELSISAEDKIALEEIMNAIKNDPVFTAFNNRFFEENKRKELYFFHDPNNGQIMYVFATDEEAARKRIKEEDNLTQQEIESLQSISIQQAMNLISSTGRRSMINQLEKDVDISELNPFILEYKNYYNLVDSINSNDSIEIKNSIQQLKNKLEWSDEVVETLNKALNDTLPYDVLEDKNSRIVLLTNLNQLWNYLNGKIDVNNESFKENLQDISNQSAEDQCKKIQPILRNLIPQGEEGTVCMQANVPNSTLLRKLINGEFTDPQVAKDSTYKQGIKFLKSLLKSLDPNQYKKIYSEDDNQQEQRCEPPV